MGKGKKETNVVFEAKTNGSSAPASKSCDFVQKSIQMLLVGASSADPFSTIVVDPRTGVSSWSYKGSELQGAAAGNVIPLGNNGDHFVMTTKERPLINCMGVQNKDRFHKKSVVAGSVKSLVSSQDGTLLFAAIATKIYIWLLTTGELLSVVEAHYQPISRLSLASNESLLITASEDGAVHVYIISELVSTNREINVKPLRKWQLHSLPVKDLVVSGNTDPLIITCGLDHVANVQSISLDTSLIKISADRPLTSCTLDPAETRLFLGSDLGNIAQINLNSNLKKTEMLIQTSDEKNITIPVFNGHSDEITALTVGGDGSLLASGDVSGKYCLWEINSRQCLRVSSMRGPISTLIFIPNWPSLSTTERVITWRPAFDLQRNPSSSNKIQLDVRNNAVPDLKKWKSLTDKLLDSMLSNTNQIPSTASQFANKEKDETPTTYHAQEPDIFIEESSEKIYNREKPAENVNAEERIKQLIEENKRLRRVNAELYNFSAKQILEGD